MISSRGLPRRRVLQIAAAAPVISLSPSWSTAASASGTPVGIGRVVQADGIAGVSLSWTGSNTHGGIVRALVDGGWGAAISINADHGHGPDDPSGREHGPAVLIPGATAYSIAPAGGGDLRVHELPARPRSLRPLFDEGTTPPVAEPELEAFEPMPGLKILERSNWTDIPRRDTIDCGIPSSVFGLGCRSDVGLRHGIVHHTVNTNSYTEADVPDLLWGIQRYHVNTRGWDDIGYNFVIDHFGRIWQARQGDLYEPIASGHTSGLNAESVGVAILGTFTSTAPPDEVIHSLGLLLGWKLSLHGVDPLGHTLVRSAGGDYAERGEFVDVRNISGHRDNQNTACPGALLYGQLDEVRTAAAEMVPVFGHVTPSYSLEDVRVKGWAIDRFSPADAQDIEIIVDGGLSLVLTADLPVDDLEVDYPNAGSEHGFDHTVVINIDTTSVVVRATAGDDRTADLMNLTLFATFIDVEPTRFFAPGVYFLRKNELTTGTRPGLFEPMDFVTRGQMAAFLHRFMDLPEYVNEAPFEDLVDDSFYADAVHWLFETRITVGTSPTTFAPEEFVTRGQMAAFLWRMCGEPEPAEPLSFKDVPPRAYYADPVAWMAALGITTGTTPVTFDPLTRIRRGEMAAFLYRLATTPEAWTLVESPSAVDLGD
jgi:hypothetical protein